MRDELHRFKETNIVASKLVVCSNISKQKASVRRNRGSGDY